MRAQRGGPRPPSRELASTNRTTPDLGPASNGLQITRSAPVPDAGQDAESRARAHLSTGLV
ncbi:MAG: hypothetical protein ACK5QD_04440, partial [Brevundimonas sp.]|uniref:hypothetical protein n=1 Tax=Brevundimonas sp. TaxID=1871086 RepID=UPI00391B4961